jgi:hypothetical protein
VIEDKKKAGAGPADYVTLWGYEVTT